MSRNLTTFTDKWLGSIVAGVILIIAIGGVIWLFIALATEKPNQWCQPDSSICITPASPQYCRDSVCITAVPTSKESQ